VSILWLIRRTHQRAGIDDAFLIDFLFTAKRYPWRSYLFCPICHTIHRCVSWSRSFARSVCCRSTCHHGRLKRQAARIPIHLQRQSDRQLPE
jgi:hypothetical protein